MVTYLLTKVYESKSFGERKGAAYLIAGLMSGLGLRAMKDFDFMTPLVEKADSKDTAVRQGSLLVFETTSGSFATLFEP